MDLSTYTFEQIIELKNRIDFYLHSYEDGYFYICNVRSYGRNWQEHISNSYELQELCYRYNGDDGIVDVYSNNPNLSELQNYGDTKYVPTKDDYEKWRLYETISREIPNIEKEWEEWNNRDKVPFSQRPHFEPYYPIDYLEQIKKQLSEYDMSFVAPKSY